MPAKRDTLFNGDTVQNIHASCVAYEGHAVLFIGPSGSGKSALALQLLALGATLVADDRTVLRVENHQIQALAPDTTKGLIEARFVGILKAEYVGPTPVALVVDLEHEQTERLPKPCMVEVMGHSVPIWKNVRASYFPAAILQYLKRGLLDT